MKKQLDFILIPFTIAIAFVYHFLGAKDSSTVLETVSSILKHAMLLGLFGVSTYYATQSKKTLFIVIQALFSISVIGRIFRIQHLPGASILQLSNLIAISIAAFTLIHVATYGFKRIQVSRGIPVIISLLVIVQIVLAFGKFQSYAMQTNIPIIALGMAHFAFTGNKKTDDLRVINMITLQSTLSIISSYF